MNKKIKKISFLLCTIMLVPSTFCFSLRKKIKEKKVKEIEIKEIITSDLFFSHKAPFYSKKDLNKIEKSSRRKIPSLVKKIFSGELDIRDLCFVGEDYSEEIIINSFDLFYDDYSDSGPPTETAIPFGVSDKKENHMFFIDKDCIWDVGPRSNHRFVLKQ